MKKKIIELSDIELKGTSFSDISERELNMWLFIDQMQISEDNSFEKLNREYIKDLLEYYG